MMKNNNYKIPAPNIKFDGKRVLKRRNNIGAIVLTTSAVAAMLIVGGVFYFDQLPKEVIVAEVLTETLIIDSVKTNEKVDNINEEQVEVEITVNDVKNFKQTTQKSVKIITPPPVGGEYVDEKLQKIIENPIKREKLPQILIKPATVLAEVKVEKLTIAPVESGGVYEDYLNTNPNIHKFVDGIKSGIRQRREQKNETEFKFEINPHLKSLFGSKQKDEKLISKNDE